jgi:hypothetical protein
VAGTDALAVVLILLPLSLLGWPESRIGMPVNGLIIAAVLVERRVGWL